jgi:antitoxin VapB
MYNDANEMYITAGRAMALQIANKSVIEKIEALSRATGLSKTAAVEKAVDKLLADQNIAGPGDPWQRFDAILAQIDLIPEIPDRSDPLEWDECGLPR